MPRVLVHQVVNVVAEEDGDVLLLEEVRTYDDGSQWRHQDRVPRRLVQPDARAGIALGARFVVEGRAAPVRLVRALPAADWEIQR